MHVSYIACLATRVIIFVYTHTHTHTRHHAHAHSTHIQHTQHTNTHAFTHKSSHKRLDYKTLTHNHTNAKAINTYPQVTDMPDIKSTYPR